MKKCLTTLIIIILLATVSIVTFAVDSSRESLSAERDIDRSLIIPQDYYLPLSDVVDLAVSSKYIAIVSKTKLTVYDKADKQYFDIAMPSDGLRSVSIAGKYILLYYIIDKDNKKGSVVDIATKTISDVDIDSASSKDDPIDVIVSSGDIFYIKTNGNILYSASLIKSEDKFEFDETKIAMSTEVVKGDYFWFHSGTVFTALTKKNDDDTEKTDITKYDVAEKKSEIIRTVEGKLTGFIVGERGVLYQNKNLLTLVGFDGSDISKITTPDNGRIYMYGDDIYQVNNNASRLVIYSIKSMIETTGNYLGDKGIELGRLDEPNDVAVAGQKVMIADKNNKRIIKYDSTTKELSSLTLDFNPIKIAINSKSTAVSDEFDKVYIYIDNGQSPVLKEVVDCTSYGDILDMSYHNDKLLILMASGDILEYDGKLTTLITLPNSNAILSNSNSEYLYVFSLDKVKKLNVKTRTVDIDSDLDSKNVIDYAVDYVGSIYLTRNTTGQIALEKYTRDDKNIYSIAKSFELVQLTINHAIAMQSATGDLYIVDKNLHKLEQIDSATISSVSVSAIGFDHPNASKWTEIVSGVVNKDTFIYYAPNNDEAIISVDEGSVFLTLSKIIYDKESYLFGLVLGREDTMMYLREVDITTSGVVNYDTSHPRMTPIFPSGAIVYQFPFNRASVIDTIRKPIQIELLSNVGGDINNHVWQWYKVRYTNASNESIIGYIEKNEIYYSSSIAPPSNRRFLTVQSDRLGYGVKLYAEPSVEAEVLNDNISDGAKVVLSQEHFDKGSLFTKVIYDNMSGYILSANLIDKGLTGNQILGLIITIILIAILIVLVVLLVLRRKSFKKKNEFLNPII